MSTHPNLPSPPPSPPPPPPPPQVPNTNRAPDADTPEYAAYHAAVMEGHRANQEGQTTEESIITYGKAFKTYWRFRRDPKLRIHLLLMFSSIITFFYFASLLITICVCHVMFSKGHFKDYTTISDAIYLIMSMLLMYGLFAVIIVSRFRRSRTEPRPLDTFRHYWMAWSLVLCNLLFRDHTAASSDNLIDDDDRDSHLKRQEGWNDVVALVMSMTEDKYPLKE